MSPDAPVPIGPVEMALIGFPGDRFDESIIPALAELVESGTVRVIDLVLVKKDADGNVTAAELTQLDADEAASFDPLEGEIGELFSDEDLAAAGAQLPPDSAAALLLWENSWATRLAAEVAGAGGQVLFHDRVPEDVLNEALAAQLAAQPFG
jgi:uncharacterized membrane protein